MILQRLATAIREQNWFTVLIETLIVVFGVFIGLQVQQWAVERDRQHNEREYLTRLQGEVAQLLESRKTYDTSRTNFTNSLVAALDILNDPSGDAVLTSAQCDAIAGSAHTTVPPAELPTVTELLSTGRLDQLTSAPVRTAILNYTQDASRARDLIMVITSSGRDLGKAYPHLIRHHTGPARMGTDGLWLNPDCDTRAMRADPAFMNELNENTYMYSVYTERAVLPVSRELATLYDVLNAETGVEDMPAETTP